MTWTISHRQAWSVDADYDALWTYMWDTYLPSKGWTVSAGPDSFARYANYDVTNAWTGQTQTYYWFVDWTSSTNPTCDIYPASGSTTTRDSNQVGTVFMDGSQSEVLFWDSSEDSNAALITVGAGLDFFWPGDSARWFLRGDQLNALSDSTTYILPAVSGNWKYYGWQADPSDTSASSRYRTAAYIGFNGEDIGESSNPQVPAGAKTMRVRQPILGISDTSALAGDNSKAYNTRGPIVQLTGADVFLQFGATVNSRAGRLYVPNALGYDGTNYFLSATGSSNYIAFDCGAVEPVF